MSARYGQLKAFKFPDRIQAIRDGTVAGPVHVQLILSDLCNQNCGFCAFRDGSREDFAEGDNHNPNRQIQFEKVIEILDDCVEMGVKAIELTGGGEPTIHRQFPQVIKAINDRCLQWGIVTNGVRHQDLSTATWIRVSLDAGTEDTYAKVRRVQPIHFEKALETIKRWKPGVSFVVTKENWHEIFDAAQVVKWLGAKSFRVRAHLDVGEKQSLFDGFLPKARELEQQALGLSDKNFEVHAQLDADIRAMDQGHQDYSRCGYQHFTTWIGADLNLYRCCLYAYTPRGLIGSIKERRFKDVWRDIAIPDFHQFDARGCVNCRYGPINRAINEVVDPDPSEAFV